MKDHRLLMFFIIFGVIGISIKNQLFKNENQNIGINSVESNIVSYYHTPDCVKLFSSIEKHAENYKVPLRYALGIAYKETRYNGPSDWEYDPKRESSSGALGPMQIMPSSANSIWEKKISKEKLRCDLDFNVETSMKILKHLYDKYQNWKIVFGAYNTGKPIVNKYAEIVYNF